MIHFQSIGKGVIIYFYVQFSKSMEMAACKDMIKFHYKFFHINPLKPEFTIVIFIHYKPRIAVAILDL